MSAEFPFVSNTQSAKPETLPPFREWAWDFDEDTFLSDGNGKMILLEGNAALEVWIYKALRTERFRYLAYTWRFGMEMHHFIGKVIGVQERRSELRRLIVECLMVNPYIKSIDSLEFVEGDSGRSLEVAINLTTIYGEMKI